MKNHQFKPVKSQVDFPSLEKEILLSWEKSGTIEKYLHKNDSSKETFSFIDGPITANNPMGIHHAWGRTYKDLWQKFNNMQGRKQRFQNGFDCQGLWVEVEVEKELGFKNKKEIEVFGIAEFVNKCKERVVKYAAIQTEQSKRLGYFMDWDNSYFTMSDENNYMIWHFLKVCWQRGWIYKGHDSIPWCPRCETAISQHEILTEDYQEVSHESIIIKYKLEVSDETLLVWTTTPWTLPGNIAVAVDPKLDYSLVEDENKNKFWVASARVEWVFGKKEHNIIKTVKGNDLVGRKYLGPFDDLESVQKAAMQSELFHTVIAADPLIMPITTEEGTGLVHTAVSAGEEDFKMGKKLNLPMVQLIADNADYLPGLGEFSGQNAKKNPRIILDWLSAPEKDWVFSIFSYKHRYPQCWRCHTELVWKVADEWYISMDQKDPDDSKGRTLRQQLVDVTKDVHWLPEFGLDRELDWLKNMHDWLISKKNRYWGLALPIYECKKCGHFEIIGDKEELKNRAVEGWEKFEGNTPHRPWIDEIKIKCSSCGELTSRILDVGNPWLDAGIVPFSTLKYATDKDFWKTWFPADFITESFPGQFKNWFYSLLVMSTVLEKTNPFKTVLGFATMLDGHGKPFHKSSGNAIEFVEGADKFGADVIRWLCAKGNPAENILFDEKRVDEARRQFFLTLWNVYSFFITYASLDNWQPSGEKIESENVLDQWINARTTETTLQVTDSLEKYDARTAANSLESLVSDLSLWYIRRSRDRVGPSAKDSDDKNNFYQTCHLVLVTICQLLAPLTPFIAEEMYRNLTGEDSVHLSSWPRAQKNESGEYTILEIQEARKIVELGHAKRKENNIKVRQPLGNLHIKSSANISGPTIQLIKDELNIKNIELTSSKEGLEIELDTNITPELAEEGKYRDLVRQIQDARKEAGTELNEMVVTTLPEWPEKYEQEIKSQTLSEKLIKGPVLEIKRTKV